MAKRPELITIPSPIDMHVHLREPGTNQSETIASGTKAALAGGYQAVFDMPNNPGNPTWTDERLREKQVIARRTSRTDIGFYAGIDLADPNVDEIPRMIEHSAGLKLYMGHTTGNTKEHTLETARPVIDLWVDEAKKRGLHAPILLHALGAVGAQTVGYIVRNKKHHAHWCHVSTAKEVAEVRKFAKYYGERFTAEVTPHHLTMTHVNAEFQQGWYARMQPALGREADHDALLAAYNHGVISVLATDHAPHPDDSKLGAEDENPEGITMPDCKTCFGVSGIEFVLPVMTALVKRKKITMERLVDSLYDQPKRALGLGKHALRAKTLMELDTYRIGERDIVGNSDNTPYIGWPAGARVVVPEGWYKPKKSLTIFEAQSKTI